MESIRQGQPIPAKSLIQVKNLLVFAFALDFILILAIAASVIANLCLVDAMPTSATEPSNLTSNADTLSQIDALLYYASLTFTVMTGLVWLAWIALGNRLLDRLGAHGRQYSSIWSLGWYFVPVMKLWKPYHAIIELAQVSADPENWKEQPLPPLVSAWWLLSALSGGFVLTADHQLLKYGADDPSASAWQIVAAASTLILIVVWVRMVCRIHASQMKALTASSLSL